MCMCTVQEPTAAKICRCTVEYLVSAMALYMEGAAMCFAGRSENSPATFSASKTRMACESMLMTAASLQRKKIAEGVDMCSGAEVLGPIHALRYVVVHLCI